jgi:hypothetical protein
MSDHKKLAAALAITAALLVPLAVFGAPAFATSLQSSSAQYEYGATVTICHRTHSATNPFVKITISIEGWRNGHSRHSGDILLTNPNASCPTSAPATAESSSTTTTTTRESDDQHGKSGNQHGKSGQQHGKP